MKRVLISVAVVLTAAAWCADNWWESFGSDITLFGRVNVQEARALPELDSLIDGQDKLSRMAESAQRHLSVDLESVTEVWFGLAPSGGRIVVLRGTYNLMAIRGVASANPNLTVSSPPGAEFVVTDPRAQKPTMVGFLDPRTAVLGPAPQVEALLANLASGSLHARAKDLAAFAKPEHGVECLLLELPEDQRRVPRVIADNIALLVLSAEAGADAALAVQLTVVPKDARMVAPLAQWCQSTLELLRLLPPEQTVSLPDTVEAPLREAMAEALPEGVRLSTRVALALVRQALEQALRTGGPRVPPAE